MVPWGAYLAWREKKWLFFYPAAWFALACVSLQMHRPIWFHLTLLATIPAALLAALPIADAWHRVGALSLMKNKPRGNFAVFVLASMLVISIAGYRVLDKQLFTAEQHALLDEIAKYKGKVHWILTDRPIYAFRSNLPVPPLLAVSSWKRIASGGLSDASVLELLETRSPEIILLVRWRWEILDAQLKEHYRLVIDNDSARLYVRSDLQQ
jgi:hypothetical protein